MRRVLIPVLTVLVVALAPGLARAATTGQIVRFSTSLGNIDVRLLPQYAPKTVANFLSYVNSGAYNSTFFHRLATGFVLQGGGYYVDSSGSTQTIPTQAPVQNEYNLPNTRGTLAMALTSSSGQDQADPNSATDEWFFNLTDNSSVLDSSTNGPFTVFGVVLDQPSLNVMDEIAALPVVNDSSQNSDFATLPVRNYASDQTVASQNYVMTPITVLNDTTPPVITITQPVSGEQFFEGQSVTPQFTCDDGNGTGVQRCASTGPVDTSTPGQHTFTVAATDYAGNGGTRSVSYVVDAAASTTKPKPQAPSLAGSLTVSRSGTLTIKLRCAESSRCAGRVSLYAITRSHKHAKRTELGSGRYSIGAHKQGKLSLHLRHVALTLLHRARGHLRVSIVLAPSGGKSRTLSRQMGLTRR